MKTKAERFVSSHIRKHKEELGMDQEQAVAVALHEARDKGYNVAKMERSK